MKAAHKWRGGRLRFAGWVVVNHIIDGFKEDPGVVFLQIIAGEMGGLGLLHSFFFDKWTSVLWLS